MFYSVQASATGLSTDTARIFHSHSLSLLNLTSCNTATDRVSFLCLVCTQQAHREEVCELRSTVTALKMQIQQLGDAMKSAMAGDHTNCNTSTSLLSYAAAIYLIPYGTGLETNHVLPLRAVQIAMTLCAL